MGYVERGYESSTAARRTGEATSTKRVIASTILSFSVQLIGADSSEIFAISKGGADAGENQVDTGKKFGSVVVLTQLIDQAARERILRGVER